MAQTVIYILFSLPGLAIVIASILLAIRGKGASRIRYPMINLMVVVALSMLFYAQYYNPYLAARYSWGFDFHLCGSADIGTIAYGWSRKACIHMQ